MADVTVLTGAEWSSSLSGCRRSFCPYAARFTVKCVNGRRHQQEMSGERFRFFSVQLFAEGVNMGEQSA